jgi:hypothetical protein
MKTIILGLGLIIIGFLPSLVFAQSVGLDIHIGNRPAPPPPMVVGPPPIVLETPPNMVYVGGLGAYVAVGIPQDLFFYNNSYYYHHNGFWYRSAYYRGPWVHTEGRGVPPGLYGHRVEELREYKRHAWEDHRGTGTRFRERHFRAEEHDERHSREIR